MAFHKLLNKIPTASRYLNMGISLGDDLGSKWVLATMLPRLKLHRMFGCESTKTFSTHIRVGTLKSTVHFRDQDIFVFDDVFGGDGYIGRTMYNSPPRCIVDIGAHIGLATLRFVEHFPRASIHCYEPDPDNYKLLTLNTWGFKNVLLHPEAVGPMTEKGVLYVRPKRHTASSLSPRQKEGEIYKVECTVKSLDDVISAAGESVDCIKFDMEGGEQETFANSVLVHQVRHIVGEMKSSRDDLENFLKIFSAHKSKVQAVAKDMYLIHLFHGCLGDKKSV